MDIFSQLNIRMDYRKNASHDQKKYSWHMRSKLYLPVTVVSVPVHKFSDMIGRFDIHNLSDMVSRG